MRIAIDARYLSSEFSGIGNYCENLLRRLIPMDERNQYSIFVHSSYDRNLTSAPNASLVHVPARPLSLHSLFWLPT